MVAEESAHPDEKNLKPEGYLPRVVDGEMRRGLGAAGWVVIEGPRACGKTWTGLRFARSAVRLDIQPEARIIGDIEPTALLEGPSPRLLDEWQVLPTVWNHIRHKCDATAERGLFILAGSAQPADDITRHTGAGRVRRIRMRPMSLFESGHSGGEVSVAGLLQGEECSTGQSKSGFRDVVEMICRGGWPGLRDLPISEIQQNLRDYLGEVARTDVRHLDGTPSFDPDRVERLLLSLARNTATEASISTLAADVEPAPIHRHTVRGYLHALRRLFVLEEQPAWSVRLRSRAALRKSPKLHLADPSLSAAALGADPGRLMSDPSTLGLLFESLVVRDLRVLSQPLGGRVMHLRDASGQEADAVVECPDGRRIMVEIKLGGAPAIDAAARSLLRLARNLPVNTPGQRATLVVITATGYGYTRRDGVRVVPATALGP